ncbi:HD-GYP domain-containing protein [Desulfitobacterium sp. Sab5]
MSKTKLAESSYQRAENIKTIDKKFYEINRREEEHCRRVSKLCQEMGNVIGLSDEEIVTLKCAALFHDIGKVGIDREILNKPGKLTEEEWQKIKQHPEIGYRILCTFNGMVDIAENILAHHERWDGKGYPKGLKGTAIPLYARISAIADTYDAMTNERSYRKALPKEIAVKELQDNAGTQFDPHLVQLFLEKVIVIAESQKEDEA